MQYVFKCSDVRAENARYLEYHRRLPEQAKAWSGEDVVA